MSALTQARTPQTNDRRGHQERTHGAAGDRDERLLLTVVEAARRLGIGRTLMFELIRSGAVRSVRVGRLRRVPVSAVADYVEALAEG